MIKVATMLLFVNESDAEHLMTRFSTPPLTGGFPKHYNKNLKELRRVKRLFQEEKATPKGGQGEKG